MTNVNGKAKNHKMRKSSPISKIFFFKKNMFFVFVFLSHKFKYGVRGQNLEKLYPEAAINVMSPWSWVFSNAPNTLPPSIGPQPNDP